MPSGYHAGELAMQAWAGTVDRAAAMERTIHGTMPPVLQQFLARQTWVIIAAEDAEAMVWASVLTGDPGFLSTTDGGILHVDAVPGPGDPLSHLGDQAVAQDTGFLAIDLTSRRRARVNGALRSTGSGLTMEVAAAYSNCSRHIQRRQPVAQDGSLRPSRIGDGAGLSPEHMDLIRSADTAFVGTVATGLGADASHRGGPPGFLRCDPDGTVVRWTELPGNGVFNTLGNIQSDGRASLTIPCFDTGDLLQISGHASIAIEPHASAPSEDALIVTLHVGRVLHTKHGTPLATTNAEGSQG